ncbi:Arm DNA-binding domain-containing protein [Paraburkholderia sediminicola]|uniref:Arm DNA-binding domain-containing protein n=1 Tax=Paraburkholderia sediminicola TaxID=458836 RepID=UPI0038BCDD9A
MYLRVSVSGSKVWKFDYRLDGKDCSYTLGRLPDLSISDARQRRNDAARPVASGIHPKAHEQQLQLQTITHNKNFRDNVQHVVWVVADIAGLLVLVAVKLPHWADDCRYPRNTQAPPHRPC